MAKHHESWLLKRLTCGFAPQKIAVRNEALARCDWGWVGGRSEICGGLAEDAIAKVRAAHT